MRRTLLSIRDQLDRTGIVLSGLCALHCLLGLFLISLLGIGGAWASPEIHRVGLALAVVIGAITLGLGVRRHGRTAPLLIGACGLALMACALLVGHGLPEALFTIAGVGLVALAHIRNLREAC